MAKTHLSRLLKQVEEGEEVVISNRGERVAKLVAFKREPPVRRVGFGKGTVTFLGEDFDRPLEQFAGHM